jgi:hypothetical protein
MNAAVPSTSSSLANPEALELYRYRGEPLERQVSSSLGMSSTRLHGRVRLSS